VLSTCNRSEIYVASSDPAQAREELVTFLSDYHHVPAQAFQPHLFALENSAAVAHLFRVAAGLDSLVVGEPQILGQVKEAWAVARSAGTLGQHLDRLFQHAFSTAKRARTDTRIGANPVSVASAAVRLAQDSFARLDDATVLLIGAGETIELAARHLTEARVRRLIVANRTLENAQALASRFGGYAIALTDLSKHLAEADIVISSTASREPEPATLCIFGLREAIAFLSCDSTLALVLSEWR